MKDERRGFPSASNAEADELCPGRHLAQAAMPEIKGKFSDFGTAVHLALSGKPAELDSQQQDVFEAAKDVEQRVFSEWVNKDRSGCIGPIRERRIWAVGDTGSGQLDAYWIQDDRALIEDFKSLWGDISDSPTNMQLRDCAALLWKHYGDIKEITVFKNQPRITRTPTLCVYQAEDLELSYKLMVERHGRSLTPGQPLIAGEKQCRYCKALAICPAANREVNTLVEVHGSSAVTDLTAEKLSASLDKISLVENICDALRAEAKRRLEQDATSLPGWKLKPGAVKESITNPQEVFNRFVSIGGTVELFMPVVTLAKGKLKDAVKGVTGAKGKALAETLEGLIDGCTTESQNAPSLVKESLAT